MNVVTLPHKTLNTEMQLASTSVNGARALAHFVKALVARAFIICISDKSEN